MYNTVKLCRRLLDKLEPQLTKECEVLIIDDGSTEDTTVLGNVIKTERTNWLSAGRPRNKGLDIAKGKYIVFIDSDDMISDNYISSILNKIKTSDFDYCYFGWEGIGKLKGRFIIEEEPPSMNTSVWNCIYKRKMIGKERFVETKTIAEDEDFNKRVRKGKRDNILEILYYYTSDNELSITQEYAKGNILAEYNDTGILIYQKALGHIGGVEKFCNEWLTTLSNYYDITFVYKNADIEQLKNYANNAPGVRFVKHKGQKFNCDKYICASNQDNIADNVTSRDNFYAMMIHADYEEMGWKYKQHPKINKHIAVSEIAKQSLLKQHPDLDVMVIYNLLSEIKPKKVLKLVAATRFSPEKGEDRYYQVAQRLKELKYPFILQIFTDDQPKMIIDGMVFRKGTYDVTSYMAESDFLLHLTKTESWGYATAEAFELGIPVVATDYPAIHEQGIIDGVNGYVLKMDLSNLDDVLHKMYNNNLKGFEYKKLDNKQDWIDLLGKPNKSRTFNASDLEVDVKITTKYNDLQLNRCIKENEIITVKIERASQIIAAGIGKEI